MRKIMLFLVFCLIIATDQQAFARSNSGETTYLNKLYYEGKTTGTNVNVRAEPNTKAKVLTNIKQKGTTVFVYNEDIYEDDRPWRKVHIMELNGKTLKKPIIGYIAEEYIDVDLPDLEPARTTISKEFFGPNIKIGMKKSELKLRVNKDKEGNDIYYFDEAWNLTPDVESETVQCVFKDNKLAVISFEFKDEPESIGSLYDSLIYQFGDTPNLGEREGADGVYLYWIDEKAGLAAGFVYFPFEDFNYRASFELGLKELVYHRE